MPTTRILAALAALLLSAGVARAAPPTVLTYSGFLFDAAGTTPLSGVHDFYFRFYPQAVGGTQIGAGEILVSTTVGTDGYFSVVIDVSAIANDPLFRSQMYMAVRVDTDVNAMTPRIQVGSVPSALSVPYAGITGFPSAQCGAGQYVTGYDVNGNFVCGTPTGGVTGVTAGAGLTGGGTGAVTLSANLTTAGGDNGAATTVARGDHAHDARYVQPATLSASGTLNDGGNPVDWSKLKNVPTGIADGDNDTQYSAAVGGGLSLSGTAFSVAAGGVTAAMLGAGAVGTSALADGSVTAAKLAAGAIGTTALADGSITAAKLGAGSVGAAALAAGAVTGAKLAAGAVGAAALGPDAVTSVALASGSVYFEHLNQSGCAANQIPRWSGTAWTCSLLVDTTGCAGGQVLKWTGAGFGCQADSVNAGTVTSIATNNGLTGGPITGAGTIGIASLGVTSAMLADGAVTAAKLGAGAVGSAALAAGAVGTAALADGAVTALKLGTSAVGAAHVAASSIDFSKWATNSCTSGQVPYFTGAAWACRAGGVTAVTATAPLAVTSGTGNTTPALTIGRASVDAGYITSAEFNRFNSAMQYANTAFPVTGDGIPGSPFPLTLNGCTAAGQVLRWSGAAWVCDFDVTGVFGGSGLSGSITSGSGTLAIATGGVNFGHWSQNGCTANQIPKWNGAAWACAADANSGGTVTSVTTGSGLTGGPISTTGTIAIASGGVAFSHLAQNGCTAGQIPKWNGTAWACAADNDTNSGGTVTSVATGVGLTGGPITTSGTVAVSFAGTGALNTVARSDHTHSSRTAGVQVTNFASTVAVNSELSEATLLTLPTTNAAGNGVALTAHTTIERPAASTSYLYVYIRRAPCDTGLPVGFVTLRGASQGIAGESWISEVISITGFDASAPANTTYVLCAKKFGATSPNGTAYGRGMIATW